LGLILTYFYHENLISGDFKSKRKIKERRKGKNPKAITEKRNNGKVNK